MGYLFLSGALLAGAVKGFCGKKMGGYAKNLRSATLLNLIRMVLCTLMSLIVIVVIGDIGSLTASSSVILISAISGVSTSVFVVSWLLAVRKNAYMMIDVFLMLGTLVPIAFGFFALSEPITFRQCIGFAILLSAVFIMCSYNNAIKVKLSVTSILLLTVCGFANGVTSASQKAFVNMMPDIPVSIFNLYTYGFSAITLLIFFIVAPKKDKVQFDGVGTKIASLYVLIMAIALTVNSYLNTAAAIYIDSTQLYPLSQGASLMLSTLMATLFFKEKLNVKAIVGIVLAFIALMVINL